MSVRRSLVWLSLPAVGLAVAGCGSSATRAGDTTTGSAGASTTPATVATIWS